MKKVLTFIFSRCYIDSRSIIIFRVLFSLLVITIGIALGLHQSLLLGEQGLFPFPNSIYGLSFYPSILFPLILKDKLYIVIILLGALLLFNKKPMLTSLFLFFCLSTVFFLIKPMCNSGYRLLCIMALVSAVLPKTTLQSWKKPYQISTPGTLVALIQLFCIFFFAGILKFSSETWSNGMASYFALSVETSCSKLGELFLDLPVFLHNALTYLVIFIEIVAPFLFFTRPSNSTLRFISWAVLTSLPVSFILLLELGVFPVALCSFLILAFPSSYFDKIFSSSSINYEINSTSFFSKNILRTIISLVLLPAILFTNTESYIQSRYQISSGINNTLSRLNLNQNWGVFLQDKWGDTSLTIVGRDSEGWDGNLWNWWFTGKLEDPIWRFPYNHFYSKMYYTLDIWRDFVFYNTDRLDSSRKNLRRLAHTLCRKYNSYHTEQITDVKILVAFHRTVDYHKHAYAPAEVRDEFRCN